MLDLFDSVPYRLCKIEPDRFLKLGDLLIARSGSVGRTYIHKAIPGVHQYAGYLIRFRIDSAKATPEYVYHVTKSRSWYDWIATNSKTGTLTNINAKQYSSFCFPLPSLEVQQEIVEKIESYQKVVDTHQQQIKSLEESIQPTFPISTLLGVS